MRLAIGICAAEIVCVRLDTPLIMITPSVLVSTTLFIPYFGSKLKTSYEIDAILI